MLAKRFTQRFEDLVAQGQYQVILDAQSLFHTEISNYYQSVTTQITHVFRIKVQMFTSFFGAPLIWHTRVLGAPTQPLINGIFLLVFFFSSEIFRVVVGNGLLGGHRRGGIAIRR